MSRRVAIAMPVPMASDPNVGKDDVVAHSGGGNQPMDYVVICLVSVLVAALTFFSGFGLGTLLLPAFALFFPLEIAVAATAVVHLANNLFKITLVGRLAHWPTTIRFTLPALVTSALGASLLIRLGDLPPLVEYTLFGRLFRVEPVKLVLGGLIGLFSLFDLLPDSSRWSLPPRYVPLGGALSGFFGGLSGMQGALRSLFLIKAGLTKEQFIGTSVVSAVIVDLSRLAVYGTALLSGQLESLREAGLGKLVAAGTVAALVGTLAGARLVKKVTLETVQRLVGALLLLVALGLVAGGI